MTDLLSMPIWFFLLSWLIRQVENGIGGGGGDNEPDDEGDENETTSEGIGGDEPIGIEEGKV
jgi:hypothetical protein